MRATPSSVPADPRRLALGIGLAGLLAVLLFDAPGSLPTPAWRMAGVAWLMAVWWIGQAIPLAGTALLPLVLYPLLGIDSTAHTAPAYGSALVFLFLGGFLVAVAMERWGLHRRIALALVWRVGSSPGRLLTGVAVAVAVLSMWVSNTATTLMLLPVCMAVVEGLAERARFDPPEEEPAAALVPMDVLGPVFMLTLAYAASVGGLITLVGTPPNIVLAGAIENLHDGHALSFARWMVLGLPVGAGLLAMVLVVVPRWAAPRPLGALNLAGGGRKVLREELDALGPLRDGEKRVIVVFALLVLAWSTRSPLDLGFGRIPGWSELFAQPSSFHDATVAIAAAVALMGMRVDDEAGRRVPVLDWADAEQRVPWGVLLLFGGGFALAGGIERSGLTAEIGRALSSLQGVSVVWVVLTVALGTTFLTEVTSNTATATVLMPILAAAARGLGIAPALLMIPAALSASCAFMLPVATPPNAIVFGSGWVRTGQMARTGLVLNLSGAVWITFWTVLLAERIVR